MTRLSEKFLAKFYSPTQHPYRIYERQVEAILRSDSVLLDAGCGRSAPTLVKYIGRAQRLVGVEMVEFRDVPPEIETFRADLSAIPLPPDTVDLIISQSVFEHLDDPESVYREFARVLKPEGKVIFLTANMWDYGTLVARMVPNRYHARIVAKVEGRKEEDTFPTRFRTNTRSAIRELATSAGFSVADFRYLNQYPNYFMFNAALFLAGVAYERITSSTELLGFLRGWILCTLKKEAVRM